MTAGASGETSHPPATLLLEPKGLHYQLLMVPRAAFHAAKLPLRRGADKGQFNEVTQGSSAALAYVMKGASHD
jgi:hypothetical protein